MIKSMQIYSSHTNSYSNTFAWAAWEADIKQAYRISYTILSYPWLGMYALHICKDAILERPATLFNVDLCTE